MSPLEDAGREAARDEIERRADGIANPLLRAEYRAAARESGLLPFGRERVLGADGEIVGWIFDDDGCDNDACVAARAAGRRIHATPSGFAVTLPSYHFANAEAARAALREVAS